MSKLAEPWRLFVLGCLRCQSGKISIKVDMRNDGSSMTIRFRCADCGNYEERTV
jgi:hypothetical protein